LSYPERSRALHIGDERASQRWCSTELASGTHTGSWWSDSKHGSGGGALQEDREVSHAMCLVVLDNKGAAPGRGVHWGFADDENQQGEYLVEKVGGSPVVPVLASEHGDQSRE